VKDIGLLEGVLRYIIVGMENLDDDVRLKHFGLIRLDRSISDCQWNVQYQKQEAQLMLTTGSTRLAVSRGQQTWYHSTCYI